jgi:Protein of unknown function (DUF3300)
LTIALRDLFDDSNPCCAAGVDFSTQTLSYRSNSMNRMRQVLSVLVCSTLLVAGAPAEAIAQTSSQDSMPSTVSTTPIVALQTAAQLDSLVAPIALYPDALVAQVLAAAALPDQVAYAEDWLQQHNNLTGSALTQAVNQQSWDPSVKALTQFPSVLNDLAKNLSWASSLGQAYVNQQSDVMAAVQTMRAQAQAAGTLQSSSQITVVQQSPSTIVIKPANPDVVYVPQYNPTVVYGSPFVVPYYTPPVAVATAGLSFGAGVAVGAALGAGGFVGGGFVGGGFGWGFGAWGVNWGGGGGGGNIIYNHNTYINKTVINRTTNNSYSGYHPWGPNNPNGPVNHMGSATGSENHAWYGANGTYHPDGNYKPGDDSHYGPNGGYHPNGYFGPDGGWHEDKPGTNPHDQPNGGNNGNHGLIGGNGGVEHGAADYGNHGPTGSQNSEQHNLGADRGGERPGGQNARNDQRFNGNQRNTGADRDRGEQVNRPRSYMSGNGARDQAAADRGRASMHQAAMQHSRPQHVSAPHNSGGGRRR